jgi:hypothetical protein
LLLVSRTSPETNPSCALVATPPPVENPLVPLVPAKTLMSPVAWSILRTT